MIRKLFAKIATFFSSQSLPKDVLFTDGNENHVTKNSVRSAKSIDEIWKEEHVKAHQEALDECTAKPSVQLNIDSGKLTFPEDMTDEQKAAIEADLMETIQSFAGSDAFKSLEDFLTQHSKQAGPLLIPFTTVNGLEDGYNKVIEEMNNCKEDNEHWNDEEYMEHLMSYYEQGYKFDGIESLYNKMIERNELLDEEKQQIRDWYVLVSQDQVYEI